jgi:hypothetical protein
MRENKLYSFGCSFSTRQLMPKELFWLDILATKWNVCYESWGYGGLEYNEAFHRLTWSMKDFKKGDLIIFQFTDHNRIGVNYTHKYVTTAMLNRFYHDEFMIKLKSTRETDRLNKSDEDFLNLFEFANIWASDQVFYHYWKVWNLLSYLKDTVGIDFILLFLDQTWDTAIHSSHYINIPIFKTSGPSYYDKAKYNDADKNISLAHFCRMDGYAVGHELKWKDVPGWHPEDGHPGELGNQKMVEVIMEHINTNWDETNPWVLI